jgi:hypothetical protein
MLTRAVKLLLELALVQGVGEQILPIAHSVRPMSRFFLMCIIMYFTFLAAFSSLRKSPDGTDIISFASIARVLFFAMFVGDGNSFNGLLELDDGGYISLILLDFAIIIFTVCMLNLMIAIFSKVYKDNVADAPLLFLQHRCCMIEQCLLRPTWRFECKSFQDLIGRVDFLKFFEDSEDNSQHKHHRDLMPYVLFGFFFMVWLVLDLVMIYGCSGFTVSDTGSGLDHTAVSPDAELVVQQGLLQAQALVEARRGWRHRRKCQ